MTGRPSANPLKSWASGPRRPRSEGGPAIHFSESRREPVRQVDDASIAPCRAHEAGRIARMSLNGWNAEFVDETYARWKADPESVEPDWRRFFEGFELGVEIGRAHV